MALLLVKSLSINVGECISELWRWLAAKHTTLCDRYSEILPKEVYEEKRSENQKWQLSKMCKLRNIFIFCNIYLCKLKNVSKYCEFN